MWWLLCPQEHICRHQSSFGANIKMFMLSLFQRLRVTWQQHFLIPTREIWRSTARHITRLKRNCVLFRPQQFHTSFLVSPLTFSSFLWVLSGQLSWDHSLVAWAWVQCSRSYIWIVILYPSAQKETIILLFTKDRSRLMSYMTVKENYMTVWASKKFFLSD